MKKVIVFLIFLVSLSSLVFSFDWDMDLEFEFLTSYKTGLTKEIVLYESNTISQLDWWNQNLIDLEVATNVNIGPWCNRFSFSGIIPCNNNIMEDKDFINDDIAFFSQHTNQIDTDSRFEYLGLLEFPITPKFTFYPRFGYFVQKRKFSATDGYLQYPSGSSIWTGDEPKVNINGSCLTYEQLIQSFIIGCSVSSKLNPTIKLTAFFHIYPNVKIEAIDHHYLTSVKYRDDMKSNDGYKMGLLLESDINQSLGMLFRFYYEYIPSEGDTYVSDIGGHGSEIKLDSQSASEIKMFCLSMGFSYN